MTPPRFALALLRLLVSDRLAEPIAGDLEEEWRCSPRPSRLRFWLLVVRSIAACWIDRLRADPARRSSRHSEGDSAMRSLMQDVHYGVRLMWRNPAFTLAAVLTLALGIGANSAIFSIVNVISLKPMPYADPSRVTFVLGWDVEEGAMRFNLRRADYVDLQRQASSFDAVAAYTYLSANLTGGDVPDRVQAYRVTPNTFALLGVPAALGHAFTEDDVQAGRLDQTVISHGLWQRRFGSDPAIVGRSVVINGEPFTVAAVMPARFEYPVFNFKGDLWIPWQQRDAERGQTGGRDSATVIGRLRKDVPLAQAQAELDVFMRTLAERYPETNRALGVHLVEMGKLDDEQAGPAPLILLATVSLVLLLACANVANLLLARGISRQRELAVRSAIGASRFRICRQMLIEGSLLGLAGGVFGALFAFVGLGVIRDHLPEVLLVTQPNINDLGVDLATLGYTLGISIVSSVIFGVLPAWRASREHFDGAIKESASAGGSRGTRRLRTGLVIAEVALATLLLVGAGLLVRSYAGLQRLNPGFDPSGVMTMALTLPEYAYETPNARRQFFEALLERVDRLPGVSSAGLVNVLPFSTYNNSTRITIDGAPIAEPGREPSAAYRVASPRYHEAMRIPLLEGRYFDRRDVPDGDLVAIVNQSLARRHFGGAAVGKRLRLGTGDSPWLTVVGVVGDVYHDSLTVRPEPEVYRPLSQAPAAMMMLAARTQTRPEDLAGALGAAVREVDPAQPVYHVKPLATLVNDSNMVWQTSAAFMTLFSALALVLAAIGVYGVVAYGVSQQTREFGVRIALGATERDLLRLVLRGAGLMVGSGIVIGSLAALAMSRLIAGALYGISSSDPLTYATVIGLLAATGLVACVVPAWRASKTGAMTALRAD